MLNPTIFLLFLLFSINKKDKLEIISKFSKVSIEDIIDLSLAITRVNKKSLKIWTKKKIYNNYKLSYYCK